ncbi:MAG: YCF48-related protein, partial [Halioglobus sp.]
MQTERAAGSLLLDIAVAGSRLVAVGERGHILYSEDEGGSWTQSQVPTSVMLTRVFFISPSLGWAVGHDGNVVVSGDGGISWTLQRDGVAEQARINRDRALRAEQSLASLRDRLRSGEDIDRQALALALEEAEYQLDEAKLSLAQPVFPPPLMDIWFVDEHWGWISGAYGTLLHTVNGGRDWQDWSHKVGDPDQLHFNGVVGAADGSLYLASEWGTIFRSSTDGKSWEAIASGYEGSFFGLVENSRSGSLFAYGLRGTVYRSTDKGVHWRELDSGVTASLFGACAVDDGRLMFVGAGGMVTVTED